MCLHFLLLWNIHVNEKKWKILQAPLALLLQSIFFHCGQFSHNCLFCLKAWRKGRQDVQRLIKSTFGVYCNTMSHAAEAEIIRQINMVVYDETLAHFSEDKMILQFCRLWFINWSFRLVLVGVDISAMGARRKKDTQMVNMKVDSRWSRTQGFKVGATW